MAVESLDSALAKRDSFAHMWKLLAPKDEYRDLYYPCMRFWNKLSHRAQQRMYWFIRDKKRRGEKVYNNPLYALMYITPHPYDCNGRTDIDDILKKCKMVSAYYNGKFGIYTRLEATIFEMTHVNPLN